MTFQVEAESKIYDFTDEGAEAILSIWETSGDVSEFLDRLALFILEETLVLV